MKYNFLLENNINRIKSFKDILYALYKDTYIINKKYMYSKLTTISFYSICYVICSCKNDLFYYIFIYLLH